MPKADEIRVYSIYKIVNPRSRLATMEKLCHLIAIMKNLERKMSIIDRGGSVIAYSYVKYHDWKNMKGQSPIKEAMRNTSDIVEKEEDTPPPA